MVMSCGMAHEASAQYGTLSYQRELNMAADEGRHERRDRDHFMKCYHRAAATVLARTAFTANRPVECTECCRLHGR